MTEIEIAKRNRLQLILAFGAVYIIWGSTYLANQFAIASIPPFLMGGVRCILSGVILYIWAHYQGAAKPSLREWKYAAIIGSFLMVGGTGLIIWALQFVPSGLTALLVGTVPLWVVLIDWLRPGGQKPSRLLLSGILLGAVGVAFLIAPTKIVGLARLDNFWAIVLILGSEISWSIGSVFSRNVPAPDSKIQSAGMQLFAAGIILTALATITGEFGRFNPELVTSPSIWAMVYLVTFGTLAFAAYAWLLRTTTPGKAASYAFVNPVIAIFLGSVLANEPVTVRTIISSIIIISAVVIVVGAKSRTTRNSVPLDLRTTELISVSKQASV
ncbi:MAG: EamA family transporter [candidate division Zixibacteria bacterium]|nr:EamA family transporter [candidate division Zixibacteria bacterium]